MVRAREATLARWSTRLNNHRLRHKVIADLIDVKRQNARRHASENVPRIASEYAAKGLGVSGPLATAQYRNWLGAVDEVVQQFLRAEETEPLNLERISVESWLAEAECDASALLDAEFGWLGSQVSTLLSGSLASLDGLQGHFATLIETDRKHLNGEIEKRLRIAANRKRSGQGAVEALDSGPPKPEWPTKAASPGPNERADGLPTLFKKDLVDADLKAAVAFASNMQFPVAVLMLDLDSFKRLNDEFGHPKGDEVLARVADVLSTVLYGRGRAYRYGGEEMCAVAPNFTKDEAVILAERIRRTVSDIRIEGIGTPITVSIGVAAYPEDGDEPPKLIKSADHAMYKAKEGGRDRVIAFDQPT